MKDNGTAELSVCPLFAALQGVAQKREGRRGSAAGKEVVEMKNSAAPSRSSWEPGVTQQVPISCLEPHPYQPDNRVTQTAIDALTEQVKQSGELLPLLICDHPRRGKYYVVDGHCRLAVSRALGLHIVWCVYTKCPDIMQPAAQDPNKFNAAQAFNSWAKHSRGLQDKYLAGLRKGNPTPSYVRALIAEVGWSRTVAYGRRGVRPSYIRTAQKLHGAAIGDGLKAPKVAEIFDWLVSEKRRGTTGAQIAAMPGGKKKELEKLCSAVRGKRDYGKRNGKR